MLMDVFFLKVGRYILNVNEKFISFFNSNPFWVIFARSTMLLLSWIYVHVSKKWFGYSWMIANILQAVIEMYKCFFLADSIYIAVPSYRPLAFYLFHRDPCRISATIDSWPRVEQFDGGFETASLHSKEIIVFVEAPLTIKLFLQELF